MKKYNQNPNTGTLFACEKRSDKSPDYNGTLDVNGQQFWISLWKKRSVKSGDTFLSVAIKPKLQSDSGSPPTGGKNDPRNDFDEDGSIPF